MCLFTPCLMVINHARFQIQDPEAFFIYKFIYNSYSVCVCVCAFEIFCTLFIVWVYLLAEDVLIPGVQYSLASGVGSSR